MIRTAKIKIFFLTIFFLSFYNVFSQPSLTDTSADTPSLQSAVNLYHQFLIPETGLYDGSEYTYYAYYPFVINEGHPFFHSKDFDTGSVFYNNILYEKVPLLFDIVKEELLINDPSHIFVIKLNPEKIKWFTIAGHLFVRMIPDKTNTVLKTGFYDLLYKGNTSLIKKVTKLLNENSASIEGLHNYVVESNEYFIEKNNQYYRIKNKKSLMSLLGDNKKEIAQFIRKNKLSLKKNKDDSLKKIVAYYDGIHNNNTKAAN